MELRSRGWKGKPENQLEPSPVSSLPHSLPTALSCSQHLWPHLPFSWVLAREAERNWGRCQAQHYHAFHSACVWYFQGWEFCYFSRKSAHFASYAAEICLFQLSALAHLGLSSVGQALRCLSLQADLPCHLPHPCPTPEEVLIEAEFLRNLQTQRKSVLEPQREGNAENKGLLVGPFLAKEMHLVHPDVYYNLDIPPFHLLRAQCLLKRVFLSVSSLYYFLLKCVEVYLKT